MQFDNIEASEPAEASNITQVSYLDIAQNSGDSRRPPAATMSMGSAQIDNGPAVSMEQTPARPPGNDSTFGGSRNGGGSGDGRSQAAGQNVVPDACGDILPKVALAMTNKFIDNDTADLKNGYKVDFSTSGWNDTISSTITDSAKLAPQKDVYTGWKSDGELITMRSEDRANGTKTIATAPIAPDGALMFSSVTTKNGALLNHGYETVQVKPNCDVSIKSAQWYGDPDTAYEIRGHFSIAGDRVQWITNATRGEGSMVSHTFSKLQGLNDGTVVATPKGR